MFSQGFEKIAALREEVELQPHQVRARDKLLKNRGLLVVHGLGSGKTLTSLAGTQGAKTDVVVPAALRENYLKETKQHTTGHKPNVMSFEKFLKSTPQGTALVVDEAHNAGQIETRRAKDLIDKSKHYSHRMLLTGTPIRNHPYEIAPLLAVARGDRKVPIDPKKFNDEFVETVKENPGLFARLFYKAKAGEVSRMKNQDRFANLTKGFVDYHETSTEHYPSSSHEVVKVPLASDQLDHYKFMLGKAPMWLSYKIRAGLPPSKRESQQMNAFLTGVRQVANTAEPFGSKETGAKIRTAVSRLEERKKKDPNFKALVYSNFREAGVIPYAKLLEEKGISYGIFDGTLNDKKRKQLVSDYNSGKIQTLLITGAGSQGLDLKGTKLVQLLEPHWNNPRLQQALGRAIRYKSHEDLPKKERHVHVERYQATVPQSFLQKLTGGQDKSVDEYLDMLSKQKEDLNNQFMKVIKSVGQG